ncbi:MAG TPA: DUF6491 family protein [Caulobacteraceae bacterium]|jgi:hypothetical protein|nr:DUF6491 family protein [Caulobacteraceae bacterium]
MRGYALTAAALAALFTVSASAVAAPPARDPAAKAHRACFNHRELNGFTAPNEHTVYVRVSVNDVYKLETFGPCIDLDWAMGIGLEDRGSGGWICVGDLTDILYRQSGIGEQRCSAKVVAQLTPDEIKALPKKSRP